MGLSGKVVIEIIRGVMNESPNGFYVYWMMNRCGLMKKNMPLKLMFSLCLFNAYEAFCVSNSIDLAGSRIIFQSMSLDQYNEQ